MLSFKQHSIHPYKWTKTTNHDLFIAPLRALVIHAFSQAVYLRFCNAADNQSKPS